MNAFSRSWELTKATFSVINKDRELLGFAFLSFVFSTAWMAALIFPSIVSKIYEQGFDENTLQAVEYIIIFIAYFGLAFIATFFNVCVVYTTKVRFEGGNATFGESLRFAFGRIGLIVQWSLLSAAVGLLLRLIENLGRSFGKIGRFVAGLISGIIGGAWGIMTIFVVPVLVYEGLGPFASIKKSVEILKRTWGESLIKAFGLGAVQFLVILTILALSGLAAYSLGNAFGVIGAIAAVGGGVLLLLLVVLVFGVANTIFNTALYIYANDGKLVSGFDEGTIRNGLRVS